MHASLPGTGPDAETSASAPSCPRVGFVVSAAVGNSVVRHRTTRRLRALVRRHLADLPDGTDLVVRALPVAGSATSEQLAGALDDGVRGVLARGV